MPFRFSLATALVLLFVSYLALQPCYDTNDDVFMSMIASGTGFCPAPDEHLIFTNVVIGQALKRLYTSFPQVPWYGGYLLLVHYLAQVATLYCVLTIGSDQKQGTTARLSDGNRDCPSIESSTSKRLVLYAIYFVLVEIACFNALQFTTTAFLSAQTGILLMCLAWSRRASRHDAPVTLPLAAAVFFLSLAALIRIESLWMATLLAAPFAFWFARQASRRILVPSGVAVVMAAVLIVLAVGFDRVCYEHNPQWRGFFQYNQLRVKFNDYHWTSYSPQSAAVFSSVGWTKNDHEMMTHWFFDDPVLYSEAKLRDILNARSWKSEHLTAQYFWQACRGLLRDRSVWAVILAMPFLLSRVSRGGVDWWTILSCAIAAVALVVFLTLSTKVLPTRVYFPVLSFPLVAGLILAASSASVANMRLPGEPTSPDSSRTWRFSTSRTLLIMLIVSIAMGAHHQVRRSLIVRRDRAMLHTFLTELQPTGRELYVCWEATLPYELISPLDNLRSWSRIPIVALAWTQRTPWHEQVKARFGIVDLAQAICDREDINLVAWPTHRALFTTYAKEHFDVDLEFVESCRVSARLSSGHFQRVPRTKRLARQGNGE